ncbi:hypothetical protein REPUB_Repub06bG0179300 [Reevesia pubescens]
MSTAAEEEEEEKRFDELVEMMDVRTRPPNRRRSTRGSSSSNDPASANQPDNGEVFVQTITRFLHELKSNPPSTDPNCSTTTHHRG